MEDALPAQQALGLPTAQSSRPATESTATQRGTDFLVATLLVAEAAWLTIIGLVLYLLLT